MPSKLQLDENLAFLYRCLEHSDSKNIDFHAVGAAFNLKAPAARMRYTRLKKNIEAGLFNGNIALASAAGTQKIGPTSLSEKKRKFRDDRTDADASDDEALQPRIKREADSIEPPTKRQTRGKKIDVSTAHENDTSSDMPGKESSSDEYEESDHLSADDSKEEGIKHSKGTRGKSKGRSKTHVLTGKLLPVKSLQVKSFISAKRGKSINPPITGEVSQKLQTPLRASRGRPANATSKIELPAPSPLTPPQTAAKESKHSLSTSPQALTTEDIKAQLSVYQPGMMVHLTQQPEPSVIEDSLNSPSIHTTPDGSFVTARNQLLATTTFSSTSASSSRYQASVEDAADEEFAQLDDDDNDSITPSESISSVDRSVKGRKQSTSMK